MFRKTIALMLGFHTLVSPALTLAATIPGFPGAVPLPSLATNALPVVRGNTWQGVQSITQALGTNQLVINQNLPQAIINWNSFNIGATSAVRFNQGTGTPGTASWKPNSSFVALNRIYDQNPTLIYGKLSADGKVYLINQNGILFGPNSQVNVHTLVASSMNLRDGDFLKGISNFTAENYQDPGYLTPKSDGTAADNLTIQNNLLLAVPSSGAAVANYGAIRTDQGGKVYLIAPEVENHGSITTPAGATRLISALPLAQRPADSALYDLLTDAADTVTYNRDVTPGTTTNGPAGSVSSDAGSIGLYGATVNQEGTLSAATTIKSNGIIELHATDRIYLAPGSLTTTPVSDSKDTLLESSNFLPGQISLTGLLTNDSVTPTTPLGSIEQWGGVKAPSGQVTYEARDRVYLGAGSLIDVSGIWVDEPAGANIVTSQLNSVELNNDYGQKGGTLQGQTVSVNPVTGTSIGNINGSYTSRELTAQERSTTGGTVSIGNGANAGVLAQLIVKDGANLDFTGGGFHYSLGTMDTSLLLSGTSVVPISSASEWSSYDKVLGQQLVVDSKFGVTQTYRGIYMGGGSSVRQLANNYLQGSDAGTVTLQARLQVLDGHLDGSVQRGPYQTTITSDPATRLLTLAQGIEEPLGGRLVLGTEQFDGQNPAKNDFILGDTSITQSAPRLAAGFGPGDALLQDRLQTTLLSADLLNGAGLSALSISSNTALSVAAGTHLELLPGATLSVMARQFDLQGALRIAGGTVNVALRGNNTEPQLNNPGYLPVDERITLEGGSGIDVSGQRIDESRAGSAGATLAVPHTGGGTVTLRDLTDFGDGISVDKGATIDVSGGYAVSPTGKLSGGAAGALTLVGNTLLINGELRGLAMAGSAGGKLTLEAGTVTLDPSAVQPTALAASASDDPGALYLPLGELAGSGFSQLDIRSRGDLTLDPGVNLTPSLARYLPPVQGSSGSISNAADGVASGQGLVVDPLIAGATSVSLSAGVHFDPARATLREGGSKPADSAIVVAAGSAVRTTPGGSITLSGPALTLNGTLESQGGTVKASATQLHDLVLGSTAQILAGGYNRVDASNVGGLSAGWNPQPGGSVSLTATLGSLHLAPGSVVDVSGSHPVAVNVRGADGRPAPVLAASIPGSISLSYGVGATLDGVLLGGAKLPGLQGGAFAIRNLNGDLTLSSAVVDGYQKSGFDDLTFAASGSLFFADNTNINARRITLDASQFSALGTGQVALDATWVQLKNSNSVAANAAPTGGSADLAVNAGWIDLNGSLSSAGFGQLRLTALNDIRLSDRVYQLTPSNPLLPNIATTGLLNTAGNLILDAARIYPTTLSQFTLKSAGEISVLPHAGGISPVVSAAGVLDLEAVKGIDVQGNLLAPMGQITLNSPGGRVLLEPGSLVSTSAGTPVPYGTLDAGGVWKIPSRDFSGQFSDVTAPPAQSIQLSGNQVIVQSGARVEAEGGGSVFSNVFQPGVEGSLDPRLIPGRYVILPDNSVVLPGKSIYLSGGGGIAAGYYSILPADYAFLPGARIVTDLGIAVAPGVRQTSADGFAVVAGYFLDQGTALKSPFYKGYTVQLASDVLKQGNFTTHKALVETGGGAISLLGTTTVLNGTVSATGLPGFAGGTLEVGGQNISVGQVVAVLPEGFDFSSDLPAGLSGTLLSTSSFVGKGFQGVRLGASGATDTVTVTAGSIVDVPEITVTANRNITLENGALLRGVGADGKGSVTLVAGDSAIPGAIGAITLSDTASIHAGSAFALKVSTPAGGAFSTVDLLGTVTVDQGSASLTGDRITLINDGDSGRSGGGIFLNQKQWNLLSKVADLKLTSRTDLAFQGDFDLNAGGSVGIDAQRISGNGKVILKAGALDLMNNSGANWSQPLLAAQTGTLSLTADRITVGTGGLLFDGFSVVRLLAANNLTLQGAGSLSTGWSGYAAGQLLELQGAQILSALAPTAGGTFSDAAFSVDAGFGKLALTPSGTAALPVAAPGGLLSLKGNQVDISGTVTVPAGTLVVTTSDSGPNPGISLTGNAKLNLAGLSDLNASGLSQAAAVTTPVSLPGGKVELFTGKGNLSMATGTSIDVSGGGGAPAGTVALYAPASSVDLLGSLLGAASGAQGGSFGLDAGSIVTPLGTLFGKLGAGGFTTAVDLRQRGGDLTVAAGQLLAAQEIRLAADDGSISVSGTLDASAAGSGGRVELYAGRNLTVQSGGMVSARGVGSGASGGAVTLSSEAGTVTLAQGSTVDISGGSGGAGGTLTLRAPWITNDTALALGLASGTIVGAGQVVAQGIKMYSYGGAVSLLGSDGINPGAPNLGEGGNAASTVYLNDLLGDVGNTAMSPANAAAVLASLSAQSGLTADLLHLRPEIEVRTSGSLQVLSEISSLPRFNDAQGNPTEPGVLTLRAGGDLGIRANIVDAAPNSWGIRLAAGADPGSADPMAVVRGTGNLELQAGTTVYTGDAALSFSSGGNTTLASGGAGTNNFVQSIGTSSGAIRGSVAGDLVLNGGVIQSVTGPVSLAVEGNLTLDSSGAIRSIGEPTGTASFYWAYDHGGNISLDVTGAIAGTINDTAWDTTSTIPVKKVNTTFWTPRIHANSGAPTTVGIVTLGGGDLSIRSGAGFSGQAGTFGPGNFTLASGGSVTGLFLFKQGSSRIYANGNFGDAAHPGATVLEDFSSQISLAAGGRIDLGTVLNPSALLLYSKALWDLTYSQDASVRLSAFSGSLNLAGVSDYASGNLANDPIYTAIERVLPPSLELNAAGDINLKSDLILAPSATGNLRLAAGGSIGGLYTDTLGNIQHAAIEMSDMNPANVYGYQKIQTATNPAADFVGGFASHAATPVHTGDSAPVLIAAAGDISDLQLYLPKQAEIVAGNDIRDLNAHFQNLTPGDLTDVVAGRDIVFSAGNASFQGTTGIVIGGPGQLVVKAVGNIDLGTSNGITSNGNFDNPALGPQGSAVIVAAGTGSSMLQGDLNAFFAGLRQAGTAYATLKGEGKGNEAIAQITDARTNLIDKLYSDQLNGALRPLNDGTGDINMINSQISTLSGSADIYLLARSQVNVGKSTFISDSQRQASGIYTASGGAINIFSGGDLNVNESRVMTYLGGDITAWSDLGSLNAGRGSKTTINSQPPHLVSLGGNPPVFQLVFTPPSAGSGIRALSYDPGAVAGDIYLFAPQGSIDAGEAGIAGGKVILGTPVLFNAGNVSSGSGGIGLTSGSASTVSLGALSGSGSVAENSKMIEQPSSLSSGRDKVAAQSAAVDDFMSKWLDLRIISFDGDDTTAGEGDSKPKKK